MPRSTTDRIKGFAALAAGALTLSACGSLGNALDTRPNAGPCPTAAVLYEASRIVQLDGQGELFGNIEYSGEITDVRLYCRYVETQPIAAELEIDFAFGKGPQGLSDAHAFNYFVTVTRRNRAVLEKEVFPVTFEFRPGDIVTGKQELVGRITIPRYDESISGANFEVLVGFELTPEQLAFNRAGKRFRLDAANDAR